MKLSMKCVLLILINYLLLTTQIVAAEQDLSNARDAFKSGKINEAGKILLSITRREPANEAAFLLLAEVYYAKGKLSKCARSLGLSGQDKPTERLAFIWGACYFAAEAWQKSIDGFDMVARTSSYRPFANYYLGVIYFKLEQFFRAKRYLEDAESPRLPDRLRLNRVRLLNAIERRQNEVIQSAIESVSIISETRNSEMAATERQQQVFEFRSPELEAEADGEARRQLQIVPGLFLMQTNHLVENHALIRHQAGLTAHREKLDLSWSSGVPLREGEAVPPLKILFGLGHREYDLQRSREQLFSIADTTGAFLQKQSRSEIKKFFDARLSFLANMRLAGFWNVAFRLMGHTNFSNDQQASRFNVLQGYGSLNFRNRSFYAGPYLMLRQQSDQFSDRQFLDAEVGLRANYDGSSLNAKVEAATRQTEGDVYLDRDVYKYVFLDSGFRRPYGEDGAQYFKLEGTYFFRFGKMRLNLAHEAKSIAALPSYEREDPLDPIELSSTLVTKASLTYGFELFTGMNLASYVSATHLGDYAVDVIDSTGAVDRFQIAADMLSYGVQAQISVSDWLLLRGSYGLQEISYSAFNTAQPTQDFLAANPDYITQSSIMLSIQKSF